MGRRGGRLGGCLMRLHLAFDMDNADFGDSDESAVMAAAEVLRRIAQRLEDRGGTAVDSSGGIRDNNGNRIGDWCVTSEAGGE